VRGRSTGRFAATAVVATVLLGTTTGAGASATPSVPPVVQSYFRALAAASTRAVPVAVRASEPGSPARKLALHNVALLQVGAAAHQRSPAGTVRVAGPVVLICPTRRARRSACLTFRDFTLSARHRLVTFTTPNGPLADRVRLGGGASAPITGPAGTLATIHLYSALESSSDDLVVVVSVTAGPVQATPGTVQVNFPLGTYVRPDGTTARPDLEVSTPTPRDGTLRGVFSFPSSQFGGHLVLTTTGRPPSPALAGTGALPVG